MSRFLMTTGFQNIHKAHKIRIDVSLRIGQRVPDSRLRGQVDDAIKAMCFKQSIDPVAIFEGELLKAESGTTFQLSQSVELELWLIVVVEIVEADHGVATLQQTSCGVHPDKASGSSDQNIRHTR